MKKLGVALASLLIAAILIGGVSCGREQPKPTPTDGEGHSSGKPVSSFVIKESDDRMMKIKCDDGITFSHSYTSDHQYIRPDGTVVQDSKAIAVVKNGSVFVDVAWLIADLEADGIQVNKVWVSDTTNVNSPVPKITVFEKYELTHEGTVLKWDWDNPDVIELDGQTTELTGEPFQEYAEHVGYYDQVPRYTEDASFMGVYYKNRIIFVPIKDFVEPFGYRVEISGGIVSVLK